MAYFYQLRSGNSYALLRIFRFASRAKFSIYLPNLAVFFDTAVNTNTVYF